MADLNKVLCELYGGKNAVAQAERYSRAYECFTELFGENKSARLFSAPGRTEICGNHTDHNHGKVLAASVGLDVISYAVPTDDGIITIVSEGFPEDRIDLSVLDVREDEKNTSAALIRGVAAGFVRNGLKIGGFKAYAASNVIQGSGVSSSAAYEVLIGTVLSGLYNANSVTAVKTAQIAQYAENVYFGKPSGLMDQMASAVGGFVMIDFASPENPVITPISFDLSDSGYTLCIVDTKGSHADLTPDYAAIPAEMKLAARACGKEFLRDTDEVYFRGNIAAIREKCGDRAVLRALHFFDENHRVEKAADALHGGRLEDFIAVQKESGLSSFRFLQNVYSSAHPEQQGVAMGLYAAESVIGGKGMARVHGGGFAGTIQVLVPNEKFDAFVAAEENVFGAGCCIPLYIRPYGGLEIADGKAVPLV